MSPKLRSHLPSKLYHKHGTQSKLETNVYYNDPFQMESAKVNWYPSPGLTSAGDLSSILLIMVRLRFFLMLLVLGFFASQAEGAWRLPAGLPGEWISVGRVTSQVTRDSLVIQGGYAMESHSWGDAEISFRARAPLGTEQVQIWAGFRGKARDSRYIFALRGGDDNDIYLARYAQMGKRSFSGLPRWSSSPPSELGTGCALSLSGRGSRFI